MKSETYTKKPIDIQAIKFEYTTKGVAALKEFVGESLGTISKKKRLGAKAEAVIKTLEDGNKDQVKHIATEGDYIIKGIKGEFYPCKPDIFKKTYEYHTILLKIIMENLIIVISIILFGCCLFWLLTTMNVLNIGVLKS